MSISDQLITAFVAGVVSLSVSAIAYVSAILKIRSERESLNRTFARKLTERLYDLRLKNYPEAFAITDKLGKNIGLKDEELPVVFGTTIESLRQWKAGEASFILSSSSLKAYYELSKVFYRKPALGDKYNGDQIDRIWRLRNAFRDCLRRDMGFLFEEEADGSSYYDTRPQRHSKKKKLK